MNYLGRKALLLLFCLCLLIGASCAGNTQGRTYYETLDLATPQQAVTTFTQAFNRNDFWTVYLVLAPQAQYQWRVTMAMYKFELLLQADKGWDLVDGLEIFSSDMNTVEHAPIDGGYIFDQIMQAAVEQDALLIDLHGKLTIISSKESQTLDGVPAVDVLANVGTLQGITFRTVQVPSGRWRVYQVILPGGDEEYYPWSVPAE